MSKRIRRRFTEEFKARAVAMVVEQGLALGQRGPVPGLLHDSDQGSQYASHRYQDELKMHGQCRIVRTDTPRYSAARRRLNRQV